MHYSIIINLFALFIFLFSSFFAKSQALEGELVTQDGDTIEVYMVDKSKFTNSQILTYRKAINSMKKFSITAEEMISFTSNDGYLVSMEWPRNDGVSLIFKKLYNGDLSLYSLRNAVGEETFFVKAKDQVLKKIKEENFEEFVEKTLADCQAVEVKGRPAYEATYFENIVSSYNACINPEKYVYVKKKYKSQSNPGLKTGISFVNASSDEYGQMNGLGYFGGIYLDNRILPKFSILLEFSLNQRTTKSSELTAKHIYLQLPVLAKFGIPIGQKDFFVGLGPSLNYALVNSLQYDPGLSGIVTRLNDFAFGYIFSAGGSFLGPNKKKKMAWELRVDRIVNMIEYSQEYPNGRFNNTAFQLAFIYPF